MKAAVFLLVVAILSCSRDNAPTVQKKSENQEDFLKQLETYVERYELDGTDLSSMGLEMMCANVKPEEGKKYRLCQRYKKARDKK